MNEKDKNTSLIGGLTLFFGIFLLCTDVFFLITGIAYDMPLMRYVIYVKLALNTSNIFLILKKHYLISTVIIYTVILGFMIVGVICIGLVGEFQLYALGMLACISYNGYLHKRILGKELPLAFIIALHVLGYVGVYIYARMTEPLYSIPESGENLFIIFNSVASFGIVIIYVCLFHNVAIRSEEKLEATAMIDNLTGLYNRHYLLASLEQTEQASPKECWLALLDIDDFKTVNDTYGHLCGDSVLRKVAELVKQGCQDCIVCRWGGEEFIILSAKRKCSTDILETLRQRIASEEFSYDNVTFGITVTIGAAGYDSELTNDGWISKADEKLYFGKTHGKNQVVL